jgi:uncharacterized protein (TIGR02594 family)
MEFQRRKGLKPDGVVGPRTWAALGQRPTAVPKVAEGTSDAPWMAIAAAELGVHENSLPGQHTQRILDYHQTTTLRATRDEVPWCSSFVNWVMLQAGHQGTKSALAASWLDWGRTLDAPRPGAITVIKRKGATSDPATGSGTGNHVGFCVSHSAASIRLLGGNQGDRVSYASFMLQAYDIRGYRWPA